MNLSLLAAYFAAILLLIATPGPVVVMVANTAARFGARRALLTALGSNWASLLLIGIAALIITGLFAVDMRMLQWIGLLGCLFIGRMAIVSLYEDLSVRTPMRSPLRRRKTLGDPERFSGGHRQPQRHCLLRRLFPAVHCRHPSIGASLTLLTALWVLADFAILLAYIILLSGTALQRAAGDLCPVGVAAVGGGGSGSGVCAVGLLG